MRYTDLKQFVYNWVSNNTNLLVIHADQNSPRPDEAYITIKILGFNKVGQRYLFPPDDNGDRVISYGEDFTVSIQSYGVDTEDELQNLKDSLQLESIGLDFEQNNIAIRNDSNITDISIAIDSTIEKRFLYEVRMSHTRNIEENVGVIEDFEFTPTYN